jgi:GMP synthase (glutamine-hydrolysing)
MHIALIDASLGTPHAERNFRRELHATLTVFNANQGEIPPPVADPETAATAEAAVAPPFDAVVISGSQSSVYHDEPWIAELATWTRGAIAADLPILGVCWGHQLLAEVLGGRVEGGDYELGYTSVRQVADDPLFADIPNPFTVFATHSDHVVEVPPEATVLAENDVGVQSLRQGRVVTTQFHPEYDLRTAKAMIDSKDLPAHDIQRALDTCTTENVQDAAAAKTMFRNFEDRIVPAATPA